MKKIFLGFGLCWFISGSCCSGQSLNTGVIQAVRTKQAPVIDGNLNDECWKKAARIDTFVRMNGKPLEKQWTTVFILYDDDALYLAFECRHPEIARMKTTCTKRDQEICMDDSVEIFLDPGRTQSDYYHFMVNSKGVYYDAFGYRQGSVYNAEGNAQFPLKTSIGESAWYLEMALPYSIFSFPAEMKNTWGINFCRNMPGFAPLSQAFPTGEGFHVPGKFGVLSNIDVDFSQYCYAIENIKVEGFLTDEGKKMVQLLGTIINLTGKNQENTLVANLTSIQTSRSFFEEKNISMEPNKLVRFTLPFTSAPPDRYQVCLQIKNEKGKIVRQVWKDVSSETSCSNLILKYPSYRNALYATMKDTVIQTVFSINCNDVLIEKLLYNYTVSDDAGKTIIKKENIKPVQKSDNIISFDARNFPSGRYNLKVSLFLSGKNVSENTLEFFKYPESASEVRIDTDGTLVVGGKRFFPIGLHGVSPWTVRTGDLDAIASAGFNTISDASSDPRWLDELAKRNLKLFLYDIGIWGPWCMEKSKQYLEQGIKKVEGIRNSPVLLAYYFGDEPDIHPTWSLEGLVEGYKKMKEIDPYHPVKPVVTSPGAYYQGIYRSFTDILGIDPYLYPYYENPELNARKLISVIEKVKAAVEIGGTKQPVWVDPQIFDMRAWEQRYHKNEIFPGRMPYLKEQRYTVYRSIIEGAKGFQFWSWYHDYANPNFNPAAWEMLRALAGEMSYLHDVLVSEEKPEAVVTVAEKNISLKTLSHKNNIFIIATNDSSDKVKAHFSVKGTKTKQFFVLSENRSVNLVKDKFTDTFGLFDVHIYTDRMVPKGTLVMEKMLKDKLFAEEPKKDKDPKNLCWEGNGAKISSSHLYHSFKDSPVFAIDGDVRTCWFTRRWGFYAGPVKPEDDAWVKRLKETWKNDWLQIDFPKEVRISRIEIVSWLPKYYPDPINVLSDYEIQYLQGKEWKTLLASKGNTQEKITHKFSPITTSSIRLVVTSGLYVAEIRAYEQ